MESGKHLVCEKDSTGLVRPDTGLHDVRRGTAGDETGKEERGWGEVEAEDATLAADVTYAL